MLQIEQYCTPPSKINNNYKLKHKKNTKKIIINENCIKLLKFNECNGFQFIRQTLINGEYKNILKKCNEIGENFLNNKHYCDNHYKKYKHITEECTVCCENICLNEEVPLECGHIFHINCLKLCNKLQCPLCRKLFNNIELKMIYNLVSLTFSNNLEKFNLNIPNNILEKYGISFIELLYIEIIEFFKIYKETINFKTDITLINKIMLNILTNDNYLNVFYDVYNDIFDKVNENGKIFYSIKDDIDLNNEEDDDPRLLNYSDFRNILESLYNN